MLSRALALAVKLQEGGRLKAVLWQESCRDCADACNADAPS